MVYAIGSNISGCLGTGDTYNTLYPRRVEELCGKDIKTFAYGKGPHVLALTEDGKVFEFYPVVIYCTKQFNLILFNNTNIYTKGIFMGTQ